MLVLRTLGKISGGALAYAITTIATMLALAASCAAFAGVFWVAVTLGSLSLPLLLIALIAAGYWLVQN